mmetsp:Transcript_101552/g.291107  ORF Transcript_101552/g.291107 Transcript_101552/m.291107 type:complete len:222 (-) Transcript_101552:317-982(-)
MNSPRHSSFVSSSARSYPISALRCRNIDPRCAAAGPTTSLLELAAIIAPTLASSWMSPAPTMVLVTKRILPLLVLASTMAPTLAAPDPASNEAICWPICGLSCNTQSDCPSERAVCGMDAAFIAAAAALPPGIDLGPRRRELPGRAPPLPFERALYIPPASPPPLPLLVDAGRLWSSRSSARAGIPLPLLLDSGADCPFFSSGTGGGDERKLLLAATPSTV